MSGWSTNYARVVWRFIAAAVLLLLASAPVLAWIAGGIPQAGAERQAREAREYEAWLAAPPPPLALPQRFTHNWIADNVPHLHPGQVPALMRELKARGWSEARIAERVAPFLPR